MIDYARPEVAEVAALRAEAGWEVIDPQVLGMALDASILFVGWRVEGRLIGMVRAVGDGILYAHVQDLVVMRSHRGQGIAARLLDTILARLDDRMGPGSAIGLMAVAGLEPFYASRGFMARPDGKYGAGMTRILG